MLHVTIKTQKNKVEGSQRNQNGVLVPGLGPGPRTGTQRQTRFPKRLKPQRLTHLFLGGSFLTLLGGSFTLTFLTTGWLTADAWFSNVGAVITINTAATPIMIREIPTCCVGM